MAYILVIGSTVIMNL